VYQTSLPLLECVLYSLQNADSESVNTTYQNSLEVCEIAYTT